MKAENTMTRIIAIIYAFYSNFETFRDFAEVQEFFSKHPLSF